MATRILIVEDEKHARDNLISLLSEIDNDFEIVGTEDTVKGTLDWLDENEVDLIFLDIQLADDLSFKIFEKRKVETPIIFTTAYDKYAVKAFKQNSVDYLLKPLDKQELSNGIEKFKKQFVKPNSDLYKNILTALEVAKKDYKKRFMVTRADRIESLKVEDIAYFEGEDRYVFLYKKDKGKHIVDYKLNQLENLLDPEMFFRLNRSFIVQLEAISKISILSKSRIQVELTPTANRPIVVSAANSKRFKEWLNK